MDTHDWGTGIKPTPLLEETPRHHERAGLRPATWIDDAPTMMLPVIGIEQLSTQVGLRALPKPAPSPHPFTDGISIYDQPTWVLPVIPAGTTGSRPASATIQEKGSEGYIALLRNLVKSSGIYALSSVAAPFISLLLAPFLTHALSRTDYGALAVLNTVVGLVAGVTELGLGGAFTRVYSFDCQTRGEQLDALSTLTLLLLLVLLPITLAGIVIAPWLSRFALGSEAYSGAMQAAMLLVLSQNLTVPGLMWMRADGRAAFFSAISIANLLITGMGNIVLVGALHAGVVGSLAANGLGNAIIIACTLPLIFWQSGFHLRPAVAWSMLTFGVPHVSNLISGWVLQLSDRYLLGHFGSLSLAAGYSVAYNLSGALSAVIITPFSFAWWVLMYSIAKRDDAEYIFKVIFRWFSFVLLFAAFGLSLFGVYVLDLLFPASYRAQAPIIPVVALSVAFNGVFLVVSLGMSLQRKTWLTSLCLLFSALLNIGINLALIPAYGAMGAAIATLIAYIALALAAYVVNQRIYPVPFEIGLFLVALGMGVALYAASEAVAQGESAALTWGIHIVTLLLYGGALALLGLLPSRKKGVCAA